MRCLLQRVNSAQVTVDNQVIGSTNRGLLLFLGIREGDTEKEIDWLINKILSLRIFPDDEGKMNLSVQNIQGGLLLISQFTLYASCLKGRRPDFIQAAKPEQAEKTYKFFLEKLTKKHPLTEAGKFGAKMLISLENDGPVTIMLETPSG